MNSNNNLEGPKIHKFQEAQMQPFEKKHNIEGHPIRWYLKGDLEINKPLPQDI